MGSRLVGGGGGGGVWVRGVDGQASNPSKKKRTSPTATRETWSNQEVLRTERKAHSLGMCLPSNGSPSRKKLLARAIVKDSKEQWVFRNSIGSEEKLNLEPGGRKRGESFSSKGGLCGWNVKKMPERTNQTLNA